jgi:hypothetical protein
MHLHRARIRVASAIMSIPYVLTEVCPGTRENDVESIAMLIRCNNLDDIGVLERFYTLQVVYLIVDSRDDRGVELLPSKAPNARSMLGLADISVRIRINGANSVIPRNSDNLPQSRRSRLDPSCLPVLFHR